MATTGNLRRVSDPGKKFWKGSWEMQTDGKDISPDAKNVIPGTKVTTRELSPHARCIHTGKKY